MVAAGWPKRRLNTMRPIFGLAAISSRITRSCIVRRRIEGKDDLVGAQPFEQRNRARQERVDVALFLINRDNHRNHRRFAAARAFGSVRRA